MRATQVHIYLPNIIHNYLAIRERVFPSSVIAVVKAEAYGHGMLEVVAALESLGTKKPKYYGVAFIQEAVKLRKEFPGISILLFEPVSEENCREILEYNIIATVFTPEHIATLKANNSRKKISVHVKIDTGMNRLGIQHTEAVEFIKSLSMEEDIQLDGVYTHFAESENMNIDFTKLQLSRFKAVLGAIKKLNISGFTAHAANSGAIINHPDTYLDAVRPGISLYGYSPNSEISGGLHLKPAMKLISAVDSVKTIQPGDTVSYGRLFIAETPTNIASIPIGYADGLPRILTNQMKVLINGKSYPQIGRVTMDRIMAAIGNDSICIGDQVVLLGEQGELTIDAWEWSKAIETIPYEITCSFYNFRVPRIYFS